MSISVEKALELIYSNVKKTSLQILPIEQCLGHVLAQNIIATHNIPSFDNSAMDGYAVKLEDSGKSVKVNATIFAGDNFDGKVNSGYGIKIMTGAKIPLGTQCIVPIEDIQKSDDGVILPDNLVISRHIRLAGEDIKKEMPLLHIGDTINAHQITLLTSQGISHIKVHKAPRVALFASGNELKMHFETLSTYQLYNTNTPTLLARAQELGCKVEFIGTAKDTLEDLKAHIKSALECDLVITSGGVSVGDADFTKEAFGAYGYKILFDKIDIKPGKPTTFGKIGETLILNLPGNPLAAALNFELFGTSIIRALNGAKSKYSNPIIAKMKVAYSLRGGRRSLIPGDFDGEYFTPCENFSPGMISPLAFSNSFIMVDESCTHLVQEGEVKVISTRLSFTSKKYKNLVSI